MSDSEESVDMNERNDGSPPRRRGRAPTPFRETTGSVTVIEPEDEPSGSGARGHSSKMDVGDSDDSSDDTGPHEEPANIEEPGSSRIRQNLVVVLERGHYELGNSSNSSSDEEVSDDSMLEEPIEEDGAAAVPRTRTPTPERDDAPARDHSPN